LGIIQIGYMQGVVYR